jgi:hypothetical protein
MVIDRGTMRRKQRRKRWRRQRLRPTRWWHVWPDISFQIDLGGTVSLFLIIYIRSSRIVWGLYKLRFDYTVTVYVVLEIKQTTGTLLLPRCNGIRIHYLGKSNATLCAGLCRKNTSACTVWTHMIFSVESYESRTGSWASIVPMLHKDSV